MLLEFHENIQRIKIYEPLLDRIDIHIEVTQVPFEKLSEERKGEASEVIHERLIKAREIHTEHFKDSETVY